MKESFKLTTLSEKAQIQKFGEVKITPDTECELLYSRSKYALIENVEFCENEVTSWIHVDREDEISPELFIHPFANFHGYSDVHPYEVIKHNTPLKMTVREMDAELDKDWKMDVSIGGFAGHVNNNHSQSYEYTSNEKNKTTEIRFSKAKRIWQDKHGRRFIVANTPYKHYDYNF
jgi:hypothetical protein